MIAIWGDGLCVKKSSLKVDTMVKPQALAFVIIVECQGYTSSFGKNTLFNHWGLPLSAVARPAQQAHTSVVERPPPKGGARRGDAGGRSASREQDVRVARKISVHKEAPVIGPQ